VLFIGMILTNVVPLPAVAWWAGRRQLARTALSPTGLAGVFFLGFITCFAVIFRKLWEGYFVMRGVGLGGNLLLLVDNAFWEELGKLAALLVALVLARRAAAKAGRAPAATADDSSRLARLPALTLGYWVGLGYGSGEAILLSLAFLHPGVFQYTGLHTFGAFLVPLFIYDRFWAIQLHAVMGVIIALGISWPRERLATSPAREPSAGRDRGRLVALFALAMLFHVLVDGTVVLAQTFPGMVRYYPPDLAYTPALVVFGYIYMWLTFRWTGPAKGVRLK
jgi:hypothetical protein